MRRSSVLRLLGLVLFLAAVPPTVQGQLNRGVLEGTVTDPQGAVIPSVNVTVTNTATNVSNTTKTNNSGYYRVENLVPGMYSGHFVVSGFSPQDITNIEIIAGDVIKADAKLQVGSTLEVVKVTAAAELLETAASNASTTLDSRIVDDLPLAGRDLQQLVNLMPGVNNVGGPPGSNFGFNSAYGTFPDPTHMLGSDVSVNGGQGSANAWYLDGNLNLTGFAENVAVSPTPDSVSEFQAITNAFSAEYGRTGGAVFNVVLKSGTNAVHGDIYEYDRNSIFNARNPFTSIDSLGHIVPQDQLRFNNFGGTVGGPVVIPHIYNGKNKTFFFASVDESILHLNGNKVFQVPTLHERTGDFSEDPNVVQYGIWDPTSTVGPDANGIFQRTAFGTPVPGNPYGANGCANYAVETGPTCNFATSIPLNRLDPTAMYFINSFPAPNYKDPLSSCPVSADGVTGACNNYLGAMGSSQDGTTISLKIDHRWSDQSSFFGEFLFNPGKYNNYRVPWTGATIPISQTGWGSNFPVDTAGTIIAFGNTYVASPSLVNEFRASFSRQYISSNPSNPYPDSITAQNEVVAKLAPIQLPLDPTDPEPNIGFNGPFGTSFDWGPTNYANMRTTSDAWTILDNVTKTISKHTLKAGIMYRIDHDTYVSPFTNDLGGQGLTVDPTTGLGASGLTQFMLGAMSGGNFGTWFKPYARSRYWGAYAQDDFRVTPHLTINLGLRYDIFGIIRLRASQGPESRICLSCTSPATGLHGVVQYWGDPGFPAGSDVWPPNWNDLGPRLNFSYAPFADHKTVFRGGYDIFYTNAFTSLNAPGQGSSSAIPGYINFYSFSHSWYPGCAAFSGQCEAFPFSDTTVNKATLTTPPFSRTFPGQLRSQLAGFTEQLLQKPTHDPMMQMWNFEVQRELPGNMMISVAYVGSHGTHLLGEPFRQFDYVHTADKLKYKNALGSQVPITDYYSGAAAAYLGMAYADPATGAPATQLPLHLLLTQYPQWSGLQNDTSFDGTGIYHSMAVRVQKRYSNGLNLVLAYTLSKNIVNADTSNPTAFVVDSIHFSRPGVVGGRAGTSGVNAGGTGGSYQDVDNRKVDRAVATADLPQILNIGASYELPVGRGRHFLGTTNRAANAAIGGWRLSANFNATSGLPLNVTCPGDQLTSRCDLIGNPNLSNSRSKEQKIADWINPAAFQPAFGSDQNFWANYDPTDPRAWLFGTAGPRIPQLRSPGFWNEDTTLAKQFHLNESRYFELRWESFNTFNHQNLASPNTSFCLSQLANGGTDLVHQAGCQFGRITNVATDPRAMEFALKFFW